MTFEPRAQEIQRPRAEPGAGSGAGQALLGDDRPRHVVVDVASEEVRARASAGTTWSFLPDVTISPTETFVEALLSV